MQKLFDIFNTIAITTLKIFLVCIFLGAMYQCAAMQSPNYSVEYTGPEYTWWSITLGSMVYLMILSWVICAILFIINCITRKD